ncbi:non-specific lipid-transfer protein AP10-like [Rutidosis leptorrhynchoides]|uniref:non-specific lipid-transfer protein AP10-like n=1 Tax=Rutidosis leptorrhynchoides TaxID=125765 RepID=UPI003A995308
MVGFMVHPSESITCLDVEGFLAPCLPCLRQGGEPPQECCNGLKGLEASCRTKSDRQIACNCCKTAAITFQIREQFAEVLPDKCGVHISIPISPTVDCSRDILGTNHNSMVEQVKWSVDISSPFLL